MFSKIVFVAVAVAMSCVLVQPTEGGKPSPRGFHPGNFPLVHVAFCDVLFNAVLLGTQTIRANAGTTAWRRLSRRARHGRRKTAWSLSATTRVAARHGSRKGELRTIAGVNDIFSHALSQFGFTDAQCSLWRRIIQWDKISRRSSRCAVQSWCRKKTDLQRA